MWIKYNEEQAELHCLPAHAHLVDDFPIKEHTVTTIDGSLVLSTLHMCDYTTTESKPLCVMNKVTLWIALDGKEAQCHGGLPKTKLIDLIHLQPGRKFTVTFENQKLTSSHYLWKYPKTEKNNPLFVQTKVFVWVEYEDLRPVLKESLLDSTASSLLPSEHYLVYQGDKLLSTELLVNLKTTYINPLCVKRKIVEVTVFDEVHRISVPNDMCFYEFVTTKFWFEKFAVMSNGKEIDLEGNLFQFIITSPSRCFSVISKDVVKTMKIGSLASASAMAKDTTSQWYKNVESKPVYTHWFALKIYDTFDSEAMQQDKEVAQKVSEILCTNHSHSNTVKNIKLLYTSLLSSELDKYLYSDSKCCCLHQIPLLKGSQPDFFVVTLQNGSPSTPTLVADFKLENYEEALHQSFSYCFHIYKDLGFVMPILVMPGTIKKFSLILCIPSQSSKEPKNIVCIEICKEVLTADMDKLAKMFHAMRYAVHHISDVKKGWFGVEPLRGVELKYPLNRRVFCATDTKVWKVFKFYDETSDVGEPNEDIISSFQPLPNLQLHHLSSDKRFLCLQYDYITEKSFTCLNDFGPIISTLDKLHKNDLVYSDVRQQNIVCSSPSVLLDFDLCDKVGHPYPETYYHDGIDERHPDALKGAPRCKHHDQYSLISIIIDKGKLTADQSTLLKQVRDDLRNNATTSTLQELLQSVM